MEEGDYDTSVTLVKMLAILVEQLGGHVWISDDAMQEPYTINFASTPGAYVIRAAREPDDD